VAGLLKKVDPDKKGKLTLQQFHELFFSSTEVFKLRTCLVVFIDVYANLHYCSVDDIDVSESAAVPKKKTRASSPSSGATGGRSPPPKQGCLPRTTLVSEQQ
jgi:hypothetical protein